MINKPVLGSGHDLFVEYSYLTHLSDWLLGYRNSKREKEILSISVRSFQLHRKTIRLHLLSPDVLNNQSSLVLLYCTRIISISPNIFMRFHNGISFCAIFFRRHLYRSDAQIVPTVSAADSQGPEVHNPNSISVASAKEGCILTRQITTMIYYNNGFIYSKWCFLNHGVFSRQLCCCRLSVWLCYKAVRTVKVMPGHVHGWKTVSLLSFRFGRTPWRMTWGHKEISSICFCQKSLPALIPSDPGEEPPPHPSGRLPGSGGGGGFGRGGGQRLERWKEGGRVRGIPTMTDKGLSSS